MSTKDIVQESINSRLKSAPTRLEGGTTQDIIGSVAYELANIIDTRIDVILDNAFISTADLEHLKIRGEELGIIQKEAECSKLKVKLENVSPNFLIKAGWKVKTEDEIVFQATEDITSDNDGRAETVLECLVGGGVGNVSPNQALEFYQIYEGLENAQIINENSGYGGYEAEDIEEYRKRILEYIRDDGVNSNAADYKNWAKSVNGVDRVVVEDAFEAGAGNVNVYIASNGVKILSEELINDVLNKIKKEQIINANVSVMPLNLVDINVEASIVTRGRDAVEIRKEFARKINKYFEEVEGEVSYFYILRILFNINGVFDVRGYLLNGSDENISLTKLQAPYLNSINLYEV